MSSPRRGATAPSPNSPQQGSVLIWALFFMTVTTGLLLSHSFEMDAHRRAMDVHYRQLEHVRAFARSGITETIAWLQRQPGQPVTTFAPKLDLGASPPLNDTIDPALGLVREFQVRGSLWGRYEVRHGEMTDLSPQRAMQPGSVWDVGARGVLFERQNPARRFDQYPNRVIAVHTLRTEIQVVKVTFPAASAIVISDVSQLVLHPEVTLSGGSSSAIAFRSQTATSGGLLGGVVAVVGGVVNNLVSGTTVTGQPQAVYLPALDTTVQQIFAQRPSRLEGLADLRVHDGFWAQRRPLDSQFAYAPKDLLVSPKFPLNGTGVVVVGGNFDVLADTNSDVDGLIVVRGDARIRGPFRLRGSLVVSGALELGDGLKPVAVHYDQQSLDRVRDLLARYRQNGELRPAGTLGVFTPAADYVSKYERLYDEKLMVRSTSTTGLDTSETPTVDGGSGGTTPTVK